MASIRSGIFAAAAFSALSLAQSARAAETVVSFGVDGQKVMGTLSTVDGKSKAPVVLLFHGFTGTRDELPVKDTNEGVLSRTARQLAESGYSSLRIDFRGSGESDGKWADTTFSSQIEDGIAAIDWLKSNENVDGSRISIIGWSQGGLVAAHVAAARPEIKSVTLWAPVASPLYTYGSILGTDTLEKALKAAPQTEITAKLPWGAETTLKAAFFQQLPSTDPIGAIASYAGPLQVIVGSRDTTVAPQPASGHLYITYHNGDERLDIFDTDHVFSAFEGPEVLDTKMVPATLEWLKSHNP